VVCGEKEGKVDLEELMGVLGEMGIDGVLVEGGGELNGSLVLQGVVDEVYAFVAPKLVGGREAKTPVEGVGVECMGEAVELGAFRVESFGKDVLLRARVVLQANEGNV
jgi:diaminohydroxyphosphoribosylaminopyrimidine deaminase/5-amino-6-(5-phosphoribosylamino)uracil reductase